jgi:serine/threonine-protein kinase
MSDDTGLSAMPADNDLSGRLLGNFRLLRRLGRGAMAEVYLAEQCSLSRQVAVKVLKGALATDQTYVKRFQREAQAAASLVHANIVQIYEVGRVGDIYYIAQEYVQGLNLRQWIARNGIPDLRLSLTIIRQVAAALAKAAEQGVVHRDIKPENIMLMASGEVKVADFGLARLAGASDGVDLTQSGMTLGTPLYMSPEQVEGRPLDPRSDLYSLGVTCYQMLAGAPPFEGETALSVALQHLKKEPEPLASRRPDLPAAFCRIIHRLLAKSADDRYQSARELLSDLRQVQQEHLGEDWPAEVAGWESVGVHEPATARLEATQRLQTLMQAVPAQPRGRSRLAFWILGGLAAFFFGALAAYWTTVDRSLLADVANRPRQVPRQANVAAQFLYASQVGTEETWRAVIDYFPDKRSWVCHAKRKLAGIYLKEDNDQEAMKIFKEFAALDASEPELRAYGLAGECWILTTKQHKYHESANLLQELLPIRSKLDDPLMGKMLDYVIHKNGVELGPMTAPQFQERIANPPLGGGA